MFNNQTDKNTSNPNNNTTPSLFGNATGATQNKPAGGSLFGSSTGGLFVPGTGGGLFSNAGNSQLKTSQRKQGGLFGNVPSNKPAVSEQASKLTFGGLQSSNPASGGLFGSKLGGKKQEAPSSGLFSNNAGGSTLFSGSTSGGPSGGLFGNPTQPSNAPSGGLFGNVSQTSNAPSGGLFGNLLKPQQKPKQKAPQQPSFLQSGGLFSSTTQQKRQEKPTGTLFSGNTPGLFGTAPQTTTPTGGLFSGGDKKQGGLFPSSAAQSALFSKPTQPLASSSLFGGASKKQEQKKPVEGGLFGSTTTPGQSLFGQTTQVSKQQSQGPKFSLTGNVSSGNTPAFGSGGLFGQTNKPEQEKSKSQQTLKQVQKQKPVSSGGLFGGVTPTTKPAQQSTTKPVVSSLFGGSNQGALFNQQKKTQPVKPTQTTGGLFSLTSKQKKETTPSLTPTPLTGSLFGQKKQQTPKQQAKPSTSLLQGSSTLFGKAPQPKTEKPQGTPLFADTNKIAQKKQPVKTSQPLLSTFSKPTETTQKPSLVGNKKDETQQQKSRTISFNEPSDKQTKNVSQNKASKEGDKKPSGGLFGLGATTTTDSGKTGQKGLNLTQSTGVSENKPNLESQVPSRYKDATLITGCPKLLPRQPSKAPSSFFAQTPSMPRATQPQQKVTTSYEISRLLSTNQPQQQLKKQQLKSIQEWINLSFTRSNQIPTTQMLTKQFVLHKNQDINRFLNDLFREVVIMVNLPFEEKSFKFINKLFDQLLENLRIKEFLFKCTKINVTKNDVITTTEALEIVQLNNAYFTHHMMYKFTTQGIYLNLDSQEVRKYLLALTKKFISNHLEYLQFLQRKTEMLQLPYSLFYTLLKYCLSYNKLRMRTLPTSRQHLTQIISLVQDFEKKIITKLSALLQMFTNDNFGSFQIINKQYLPELIKMLDNFSYSEEDLLVRTALKVILNTIDLPNVSPQSSISAQLKTTVKQTRSLQLLPIRILVTCYQPNSASTLSMISAHDLYHYISGTEWIDWLQVYLSSGMNSSSIMEREISAIQAKYMLNILAYPKLKKKRITRQRMSLKETRYIQQLQKKILPRKRPISKFIQTLKEQNMLDIFYSILESLIYDYESYRRITQTFFKQKDEFIYEFKVIVAEVCNYPLQQFKEEIPFLEQKMSYFLRICEVAPQKIIEIQKMVFDGIRIDEKNKKLKQDIIGFGTWDVGHRICHLVIDTINYFGMRENQKIVAKAIACIKQLLSHEFTSSAMKLAMGVNKPQMSFILSTSSLMPLSQRLTVEMMDLLEYFLVSEEFVNMLMINLRSNNSQQVELERYYAVRYSVKDYKVLLNEVGMSRQKQPVFDEQQQTITLGSPKKTSSIEIIPSSYWFLRLLETMIRSFRQEKMSHQLEKQLLYIVNLMLERLIVPLMEGDHSLLTSTDTSIASNNINSGNRSQEMLQQQQSLSTTNISKPSMTPIYPLTDQSQQLSRVLLYMIETLNSIDIFSLIKQKLTYSITKAPQHQQSSRLSPVYEIENNLLFDNYEENQLSVYLSVSVLRNVVSLYRQFEKIRLTQASTLSSRTLNQSLSSRTVNQSISINNRQSVTSGEHKMMYKLLSRMKWLQQLQQQVFVKTLSTFSTSLNSVIPNQVTKTLHCNNDLVLGLITLLTVNSNQQQQQQSPNTTISVEQSSPMNLKLSCQKPLVVPILEGQQLKRKSYSANMNRVQKFYSLYREQMNYQQVHDFMTVTHNRYLESYQSLQTVAISTLTLLVHPNKQQTSSYKLNLIKHLTFPYQSALSSTTWLLQLLSTQLLSFLQSKESSIQLKQSILQMLSSMIESSQSTSGFIFAKRVFYQYIKIYQLYNRSLGVYQLQQSNRMNLLLLRTLNILFQKDHYNFTSILTIDFIDQLITYIINNSQQIIVSSQSIMKQLNSFNNKFLCPKEMTYYQLETSCQQRDLVSVADALNLLREVVVIVQKMFFDQQIRKFNQQKKIKYNCIKRLTSLLVRTNLPYLPVDIWSNALSTLSLDNFSTLLVKSPINYQPRVFISNPLLYYITQCTSIQSVSESFKLYKQNILNYVSQRSIRLAQSSLRFLTWSLTIDNTLYGNQPIRKLQLTQSKMSCSSHMGSYHMTAIEMFGQNQIQAVSKVKDLYQLSLHTLSLMCSNNKLRGYCFVQTITVMGYCLQWLRARRDTDDTLSVLIRSTLSSSRVWLQSNTLSHPNIIKLVHSLSNIASSLRVNPNILGEIKLLITQLVSKYMQNKTIFVNDSIIHQLLIILINFPISIEDSETISNVTKLWQNQTNSQYFYNLSRLMIDYAMNVPGELARLKVLTKCQKVLQLFNPQNNHIIPQCYHYGMRSPQSISIIWIFKLASTIMSSSEQSVLLLQQVSEFYTMASKYIESLLKNLPTSGNISFVYLELLQAVTQFLLTLVSSPGWVAVYREQFEKVAFLLSHKLINLIMDCVGGKLLVLPESEMQRRLRKQSSLISGSSVSTPQLDTTSSFKIFSDYHIFTLVNLYTRLLSQSLYKSYYVNKYFNNTVYENYRYGVSYWDRMNKSIGDILKYGVTMRRRYKKLSQGKTLVNKLNVLTDFTNCSQYFVETGYLVSLSSIPESPQQFISLIDGMISTIIELGNVHLIQQSTFRQRYQCIMKGNIQKFGNKLIDNVKMLQKIYEDNQKNYSSPSMSIEKHQTNNYPQYYQSVGRNLTTLIKNV